ncbi:GspH/FimT family pseudopilin [Alcanivorax sp. S6407]|uniref:GspH/FimT family pseudopilin n=1 Tax=Alcanivorax sp. S6407 TaxID=2926424 RepID=UPI001FF427E7|nr:GspH/FimT family pseudopilin [Alcanivorax sp. S6407]MCK0155222.1 GspH/FimT family pseudopilin [Alcanivorax sp. S6407]
MKSINKKQRGFSLIELIVGVIILGVMAAIAAPAFQRMAAGSAVRSCTMDLVTALNTARADAVNLRRGATMSATNTSSSGNEWGSGGWSLTYPGVAETKNFEPCENATATEAGGATTLSFDIQGRTPAALTFQVCHSQGVVAGRQIAVSRTGLLTNTEFNGCN